MSLINRKQWRVAAAAVAAVAAVLTPAAALAAPGHPAGRAAAEQLSIPVDQDLLSCFGNVLSGYVR